MSGETNEFIHRFVPGESGSNRTLLLLHGTGGDENDLLPLGTEIAPGAALLSPRGRVLENGMSRFFRRLAEGVFDVEDLQQRTHELADFVERASGQYEIDRSGLMAVGFSNGANIAASMMLLRPEVLTGAVLLRAMIPFEPEIPPDLTGTPVFIAAGREDPLIPPAQTERLEALLRRAGADVTLNWQSGGHQLTRDDLVTVRDWLASL